jgi:hypothetical protein
MKPRYEAASPKAYEMLRKAEEIASRLDALEKAKCPHCDGDAARSKCICGKVKKEDKCPSCGMKKMDCMMKTGCGSMKKGTHHKETSFGTQPEGVQFNIETGGQTYNAFYHTNQSLLDSEDIANKGASSESVNLDTLKVNTHDTVDRLVEG